MCKQRKYFKTIRKCESPRNIDTAGMGTELESKYIGTVELTCTGRNRETIITLNDVAYVPTLRTNLISIPRMQKAGLETKFLPFTDHVVVMKNNCAIMTGTSRDHNIVELSDVRVRVQGCSYVTTSLSNKRREINLKLLHKRLAHVNCRRSWKWSNMAWLMA